MQRLPWLPVISVLLLMSTSIESLQAMELQGHRGARGNLPENTVPSIQYAIAEGMDCIELDIAMTRDKTIVVTHDPGLNPDLTRRGSQWVTERTLIKELNYSELKKFDVGRIRPGSRYASRFPKQRAIDGLTIPRLSEVFALRTPKTNNRVCLDIEIKTTPLNEDATWPPEEIANSLIAEIDKAGARKHSRIRSFHWQSLVHVRKIAPDIETVFLTAAQPWLNNLQENRTGRSPWLGGLDIDDFAGSPPRAIKHLGGTVWAPYYRDLTKTELQTAHELGLKVIVWTVNDEDDIRRMIKMGVDGITTDYPKLARRVADALNSAR